MTVSVDPRLVRAHNTLHKLWTKSVGTPDYDKSEWKDLEGAIFTLGRDLREAEKARHEGTV